MINLALVACGLILIIYSAVLCHRLNIKIDKSIVQKPCSSILVLIYFFALGYFIFFGRLLLTIKAHSINEFLVSIIFFFGAIFVVIVLKTNHRLIMDLSKNSLRLKKLNAELNNNNTELQHLTKALKISEEKYKKRSQELDETLDDFYTIRLGLQEQSDKGTVRKENKKIKERLDKVRGEN